MIRQIVFLVDNKNTLKPCSANGYNPQMYHTKVYGLTCNLDALYIGIVKFIFTGPASFVIFPAFHKEKKNVRASCVTGNYMMLPGQGTSNASNKTCTM